MFMRKNQTSEFLQNKLDTWDAKFVDLKIKSGKLNKKYTNWKRVNLQTCQIL